MHSYVQPAGRPVNPATRLTFTSVPDPTFKEQAEAMLVQLASRKRKPVHESTLFTWAHHLNHWLYPAIGHLQLSQITHATIKPLIGAMVAAGLKPTSIDAHFRLIRKVVDSCLDESGESIYRRTWNYDFLDLPVINPRTMNRPCFSDEIVSGLARWRFPREQMIFILAAASGARIGELLGLDIDQHFSQGCETLRIERQVDRGHLVPYTKTEASYREVDLHRDVAGTLQKFIGSRMGLLFCTGKGTVMNATNVLRHLHSALHELGFVNPYTGTDKAGMHGFRRYRNTHLNKCADLPDRLHKFWMGHSARTMSDLYDKTTEDRQFRAMWAQRCGMGFQLPK
jgi:integrase